jgi:FkbM family methyltransferase
MPTRREDHVIYTRKEWTIVPYFIKVIEILSKNNIKSFLDIGSNVGEVANILSEKIRSLEQFVLIEPQNENFVFLKQNTKNLQNCIYLQLGIYYGKTEAELFQDPSWRNVGAFTVEVIQQKFESTGEKITLKTLEELNIPVVDFVKIDVEGAEYNILQNSTYLKSTKFIEIEFHNWDIDSLKYINDALPSHKILLFDPELSNHVLLEKI